MTLQERIKIYDQLLTIISEPNYSYGFCLGLLLIKVKTRNFNMEASISEYPELMKYEPKNAIAGEHWFSTVDQTKRIIILEEILNKVDK